MRTTLAFTATRAAGRTATARTTRATAWTTGAAARSTRATATAARLRATTTGQRFGAGLAENIGDAFVFFTIGAGHVRARRAWNRRQQFGGNGFHRNLLFDVGLDLRQRLRVDLAGEADRVAFQAQARGAADAVHVVFGIKGQVEVVHVADRVDVQAARGDIGGDQDLEVGTLELGQQALPLFLRHIAGQHANAIAGFFQRTTDALDPGLGVDEHHGAVGVGARQQADQQRQLFFIGREVHHLAHARGGDGLGFDDDLFRFVHVLVGQLEHAMAERGGEHQGLALFAARQLAQQETQVLDEAQVEHAVGFIEDADLASVQVHDALAHVVDQAARRGDDDVATLG